MESFHKLKSIRENFLHEMLFPKFFCEIHTVLLFDTLAKIFYREHFALYGSNMSKQPEITHRGNGTEQNYIR